MNLYNVYFVSKGTGPRTVQIEAQNSAGAHLGMTNRIEKIITAPAENLGL